MSESKHPTLYVATLEGEVITFPQVFISTMSDLHVVKVAYYMWKGPERIEQFGAVAYEPAVGKCATCKYQRENKICSILSTEQHRPFSKEECYVPIDAPDNSFCHHHEAR